MKFPPDGHPYYPPPYEKIDAYWWEPWLPIVAVVGALGVLIVLGWGNS